jgi:TPR repeat protein
LKQPPEFAAELLEQRMLILAHRKRHVLAAATANRLADFETSDARRLYNAACCYSMCAGAAIAEPTMAEKYAAQAVAMLRRALAAGWKDLGLIMRDPDLDPVRTRAEFRAFWEETTGSGDLAGCRSLLQSGMSTLEYIQKHGPACIALWRQAAERGAPQGQWLYSKCLFDGIGIPKNLEEAVAWLRKAADQGLDLAQNNLGHCYESGQGIDKDEVEALRWYGRAAEQGLAISQYNLGIRYEGGLAGSADPAQAALWFRRAAEQGHAAAQNRLGSLHASGQGVAKNLEEAARWYRQAADQGEAWAQYNLAGMYLEGTGVPEDAAEALQWSLKSVAQNSSDGPTNRVFRARLAVAQHALALTHQKKGDLEKAESGFRVASLTNDQVLREVPFNKLFRYALASNYRALGKLREQKKDNEGALEWYRKASELGDAEATKLWAGMVEQGRGCKPSSEQCKRLRELADRQKVGTIKIRCEIPKRDEKEWLYLYLSDDYRGNQPIEEEEKRLLEDNGAIVPSSIKRMIQREYEMAAVEGSSGRQRILDSLK